MKIKETAKVEKINRINRLKDYLEDIIKTKCRLSTENNKNYYTITRNELFKTIPNLSGYSEKEIYTGLCELLTILGIPYILKKSKHFKHYMIVMFNPETETYDYSTLSKNMKKRVNKRI